MESLKAWKYESSKFRELVNLEIHRFEIDVNAQRILPRSRPSSAADERETAKEESACSFRLNRLDALPCPRISVLYAAYFRRPSFVPFLLYSDPIPSRAPRNKHAYI